MNRINATDPETGGRGHFDYDKLQGEWSDADHDGNGSGGTGRGEAILLTSGGRWVLQHWSRWQNEEWHHEYVGGELAREWLLRNHEDEAVTAHFGEVEEERGPGRPEIGGAVHIRLGDLLAAVDAFAANFDTGRKMSRADAVRELVKAGLIYYKA